MSSRRESKQERRRRLEELELLEKTQTELLAWAKRRFWVYVVGGSLILGLGGYGLIQAALSGAREAAIEAKVKAKLAGDAAAKATDASTGAADATAKAADTTTKAADAAAKATQATEAANEQVAAAMRAATAAETKANQALTGIEAAEADAAAALQAAEDAEEQVNAALNLTQQLNDQARQLDERTSGLDRRADEIQEASQRAQQLVESLERKVAALDARSKEIAGEHERLRNDLTEARREVQDQTAGMAAQVEAVRKVADPQDESLQNLIRQLNDASLSDRTAAASALGQRGPAAKSALDDLKAAFHEVRPELVLTEEQKESFAHAAAQAIARIGGESSLPFLLKVMAAPDSTEELKIHAANSLMAIRVWSTGGVELLRERFGDPNGMAPWNRAALILPFRFRHRTAVADEAARKAVLDFLMHALGSDESAVVQVAADAIRNTSSENGERALPALRDARDRFQDDPPVASTIAGAIEVIEGKGE